MFQPSRFRLAILGLAAMLAPLTARADDRPYKGSFLFTTTSVEGLTAETVLVVGHLKGNATFLGSFEGEARYVVDLVTFSFSGTARKFNQDGDRLDESLTGFLTPTGTIGQFSLSAGTGRFALAEGGGSFVGTWTNPEATIADVVFEAEACYDDSGNFDQIGIVGFDNVQAGLAPGGIVPYFGIGDSDLIGPHIQTGSIRNLSGLIPIDATTFMFYGEVGPHPYLPGHPSVHVIHTWRGDLYCHWTAVFILEIVDSNGTAVFSGDAGFTVLGGTRSYRKAKGEFVTVFESCPVAPGANRAVAEVYQVGHISKR